MNTLFLIIGAVLTLLWGVAHIFPTRGVVRDFGDISTDNKRVITMEWLVEALALIFTGVLVLVVTLTGDPQSLTARMVYRISAVFLLAMATLSLFTGARIQFLPYRLCPVIFTLSAALILLGVYC
jgi:hypothetical protein